MDSRHGDGPNGRWAGPRCLVLLAGLACVLLLGSAEAQVAGSMTKPNIVLVLTDDMDAGLVERMPNVKELIVEQGATFARAYVDFPLCAPSRATILTGRYARNTGVTDNNHRLFHRAGLPDRTVAVWLQAAGYRTGHVGKYLNDHPNPASKSYVPPGWNYWAGRFPPGTFACGYEVNDNGHAVRYGYEPRDYVTDVYAGKALDFVRQAVSDGAPFFLTLSVHAPHDPSIPAPRHAALFPDLMAPRPPSFDEGTGERELYDMWADPYQLENLAGSADPALLARLATLTEDLGTCSGAVCRTRESAPRQPAGAGSVSRPAFPPRRRRGPR